MRVLHSQQAGYSKGGFKKGQGEKKWYLLGLVLKKIVFIRYINIADK